MTSYRRKIPVSWVFLPEKQGILWFCVFPPAERAGKHKKAAGLLVEGRIGEVDVFLIHALLGQGDGLTEALEVDDLPLTQEADHIVDIRVVGEAENIVIGKAGLLLWCDK